MVLLQVLLLVSLMPVAIPKSDDACRLWFVQNSTTGACTCGSNLGGVVYCIQETKEVSILLCYGMTYNKEMGKVLVGYSYYTCYRRYRINNYCGSMNKLIATDKEDINNEVCGLLNRTGQLCGKCSPGTALPVYSYTVKCVNCSRENFVRNLFQYVAVAYLPLTAAFFFVITFKISVTSGHMVAYILTCQILTTPTLLRVMTLDDPFINQFILSLYAVWNLDFLRLTYPPFCLHPGMTSLHVLALDYLVGVYPLVLILLTYIAVTLHDRYPAIVRMCRPMYRVFMCIRREWDLRGSLVQTFSTFLILSYVKILNVSFDLLTPVQLKTANYETLNQTFLLINGEIVFFGSEHLPYGILAIVMSTAFNVVPMLFLMLYPCQCFRKLCLRWCGAVNPALSNLMNAFQDCYHHQPVDCRYFAGIYLLTRIVFLVTSAIVKYSTCYSLFSLFFIILTVILVYCKPYKSEIHNKIDAAFFLLYSGAFFVGGLYIYLYAAEPQIPARQLFIIVSPPFQLFTTLYGITMVLQNVLPKRLFIFIKGCLRGVHNKLKRVDIKHANCDESSPSLLQRDQHN